MSDETKKEVESKEATSEEVKTDLATGPSEVDKLAQATKELRELVEAAQSRKNHDGVLSEDREKLERAQAELLAMRKQVDTLVNEKTIRRGEFDTREVEARTYTPQQMKQLMKIDVAEGSDISELQKANDDLYIGMKLLNISNPAEAPLLVEAIKAQYPVYAKTTGMGIASSGAGLAWVPTDFSSQLIRDVRLQLRVAALHTRFNMPTNPYTFPVEGTDMNAYLVSEVIEDEGDIASSGGYRVPSATSVVSNLTFNAKKLGVRSIVSTEITEDSIVPIIPYIREKIAGALAIGQEEAVINGDTVVSATIGVGAIANIDGNAVANDRRHAFNGYRKHAWTAGTTSDATAMTLGTIRKLRTDMGKWGVDNNQLAYVVPINVFNQMLSLGEVTTMEKFGTRATILNGQLGSIDGIPIIVSEYVPTDLVGTGLGSGTGSLTEMLLVRRDGFRFGDRRQITLESMKRIETDQWVLVSLQRLDFKALYSTSTPLVAAGVSIALA